ncbi:hypothetical protein MD484_g301, partial [Candolleomyces efflorescens]
MHLRRLYFMIHGPDDTTGCNVGINPDDPQPSNSTDETPSSSSAPQPPAPELTPKSPLAPLISQGYEFQVPQHDVVPELPSASGSDGMVGNKKERRTGELQAQENTGGGSSSFIPLPDPDLVPKPPPSRSGGSTSKPGRKKDQTLEGHQASSSTETTLPQVLEEPASAFQLGPVPTLPSPSGPASGIIGRNTGRKRDDPQPSGSTGETSSSAFPSKPPAPEFTSRNLTASQGRDTDASQHDVVPEVPRASGSAQAVGMAGRDRERRTDEPQALETTGEGSNSESHPPPDLDLAPKSPPRRSSGPASKVGHTELQTSDGLQPSSWATAPSRRVNLLAPDSTTLAASLPQVVREGPQAASQAANLAPTLLSPSGPARVMRRDPDDHQASNSTGKTSSSSFSPRPPAPNFTSKSPLESQHDVFPELPRASELVGKAGRTTNRERKKAQAAETTAGEGSSSHAPRSDREFVPKPPPSRSGVLTSKVDSINRQKLDVHQTSNPTGEILKSP